MEKRWIEPKASSVGDPVSNLMERSPKLRRLYSNLKYENLCSCALHLLSIKSIGAEVIEVYSYGRGGLLRLCAQ